MPFSSSREELVDIAGDDAIGTSCIEEDDALLNGVENDDDDDDDAVVGVEEVGEFEKFVGNKFLDT